THDFAGALAGSLLLRHHIRDPMRCLIPGSAEGQRMRPHTFRVKWLVPCFVPCFVPCLVPCLVLWFGAIAAPANAAAPCGGDFGAWLQGVKAEASTQGISQRAIQSALGGVTYDPTVIARDHAQGVFRQSFEQFSGRMVPPRLARGARVLQQYGPIFSRIQQQYGVPGAVIVAIWGLETDFGANSGRFPTIRSLAALAYDCRRPDKFRTELLDALRIVDRGDMSPSEMRGAWAGEIGQT